MAPFKCSYCHGNDHLIHQCRDSSIVDLHRKTIEIAAVAYYCYRPNIYLPFVFRTYSVAQLRVLGYPYNLRMPAKPSIINHDIFIRDIADCYFRTAEYNCQIIIRTVTDERLDELVTQLRGCLSVVFPELATNYEYVELCLKIHLSQLRPPIERRHHITPILNENVGGSGDIECAICQCDNSRGDMLKYECGHLFCQPCVLKYFETLGQHNIPRCALCRANITSVETIELAIIQPFIEKHCIDSALTVIPKTTGEDFINEIIVLPDLDVLTEPNLANRQRPIVSFLRYILFRPFICL